ncbi:hypothetical protein FB451DRAFT_1185153 [Mycena latifolia]|nr:hypothetical protein FB451DRAFT_1185153 [Mycena latifolia]
MSSEDTVAGRMLGTTRAGQLEHYAGSLVSPLGLSRVGRPLPPSYDVISPFWDTSKFPRCPAFVAAVVSHLRRDRRTTGTSNTDEADRSVPWSQKVVQDEIQKSGASLSRARNAAFSSLFLSFLFPVHLPNSHPHPKPSASCMIEAWDDDGAALQRDLDALQREFPTENVHDLARILYDAESLSEARAMIEHLRTLQEEHRQAAEDEDAEAARTVWYALDVALSVDGSTFARRRTAWQESRGVATRALASLLRAVPASLLAPQSLRPYVETSGRTARAPPLLKGDASHVTSTQEDPPSQSPHQTFPTLPPEADDPASAATAPMPSVAPNVSAAPSSSTPAAPSPATLAPSNSVAAPSSSTPAAPSPVPLSSPER